MKKSLLRILSCPCGGELSLDVLDKNGIEINDGIMNCVSCKQSYPIINGIPRMLPASMINNSVLRQFTEKYKESLPNHAEINDKKAEKIKVETSKSFGFQWNVFSEMHKEYEKNFLNYIEPLRPSFFKNKIVLDAGCGFGRHTYYAARYGAEVIGFDLSDAVDAAYQNCRKFPNVHIVQGDIYNLPFRKKFDFIMSIGVLHHLPYPKKGYAELVKLAKSGTLILAWLYGSEGRTFKTVFLEGTIRKITVGMPQRMLYYFCYIPAILYHTLNKLYRLLGWFGASGLAERIPFKNYAKFPFRVKLADAYDFLGTPINNYYSREECEQWIKDENLRKSSVTSLGGRSWRLFGTK